MKLKEEEDLTFEATSRRFGIGIRTLFRWQRRIKPVMKRNKPATKIDMDALRKDVQENPDSYQYERAKRFGVSQTCIFFALRRLGVSYKKNSESSKGRPDKTYSFPSED
jgi:transposase